FTRCCAGPIPPSHATARGHPPGSGHPFQTQGGRYVEGAQTAAPRTASLAILREVAEHATPTDRARLRTMFLPEPPLSFWKMMAAVPQDQIDNEHCLAIWKIVLRALGHIRHSSGSLGRALATQSFPEDRMDRLLTASGTSLSGLIDEALRWLVSHRVEATDLSLLATLGVADALRDCEARDWARKQMALDYVRAADAQERAGRGAQSVPQMQEAS